MRVAAPDAAAPSPRRLRPPLRPRCSRKANASANKPARSLLASSNCAETIPSRTFRPAGEIGATPFLRHYGASSPSGR